MNTEVEIARANPDFEAGDRYLDRELLFRGKPVKISERDFTQILIEAARMFYGWRVLHIRPAMKADGGWVTPVAGDGQGFSDLYMLRAATGHEIAAELKVDRNKPTEDQNAWLNDFTKCGVPAYVWYPKDLDEIKTVLRQGIDFPRCEHGVNEGDWCETCNREYKLAAVEQEME